MVRGWQATPKGNLRFRGSLCCSLPEQARWVKTVKALRQVGSQAPLGSDRRLRSNGWVVCWRRREHSGQLRHYLDRYRLGHLSVHQHHQMGLMYSQAVTSVIEKVNASHAHVIGRHEKWNPGSMRGLRRDWSLGKASSSCCALSLAGIIGERHSHVPREGDRPRFSMSRCSMSDTSAVSI